MTPPVAPASPVRTSRHMDALDAGLVTEAWLEDLIGRYPAVPAREIERKAFAVGDGSVTIFWHDNHPVGIAIALRDALNFTQLALVENAKPSRPSALETDVLSGIAAED